MRRRGTERGTVVIIALILLTVLVSLTTAFVVFLGRSRRALWVHEAGERGLALAEAGVEKAIWELTHPETAYRGETLTRFGDGFFTVTASPDDRTPGTWTIEATGALLDELDSPPRRHSSVPAVTARVRIDRFPDGRPRTVRVTDWETRTEPPIRPRPAPPRRPAAAPTSAPATAPAPS